LAVLLRGIKFKGETMENLKDQLMKQARELGLKPNPMTGEVKLRRLIDLHVKSNFGETEAVPVEIEPEKVKVVVETDIERHARIRKEQTALRRVVVRCNDDLKKEWTSVNIKFANMLHHLILKMAGILNRQFIIL